MLGGHTGVLLSSWAGRVQAYLELSKFLIEQVSQKEVLVYAESENELNILGMGWKEAKGIVRKEMITKEMNFGIPLK